MISRYRENAYIRRREQTGAATLAFTIVILLLLTTVAAYSSRSIFFESKVSGNDFRTRQAFEAAETGLTYAISYLGKRGGADKDRDGVIDPVIDTDADGIGDTNTITLDDDSAATVTVTGAFPIYTIQSVGVSDDRTATRTVSTLGTTANSLPNEPGNPLTARGRVDVEGSATVHNPEGASTIWSGDDVELGSNNATATNIADPTQPDYPTCLDTPLTCTQTRASNKVSVGLDVIEYDTSLSSLTQDEMFKNFFGLSIQNYRASRVTLDVDAANVNNLSTNDAAPGANFALGEVIWVEGDALITDRTAVGCAIYPSGGNLCPPDSLDPSILIINGDLETKGRPNFTGLVYVIGRADIGSSSTVQGAMVISGEMQTFAGGSLDIWYNSAVLNMTRDNGPLAGAPGSWRDW